METAILAVMVSLAALGFGVVGLVWRALDGRMDRLDGCLDRVETRQEADRTKSDGQHTAVMGVLRNHGERLVRIETVLVSHGERLDHIDQRLDRIEAGQGDPAQRIAHLEGREEALTAT